jgi:hypothetical protein
VSVPTDDWTSPDWSMATLPSGVLVNMIDFCDGCRGDFDAHCYDWACPAWRVACHRPHRALDDRDLCAAVLLPVQLGVRGFGCRN